MNEAILATIDAEISRLQQARALLSGIAPSATISKRGRGRPKGAAVKAAVKTAPTRKTRVLSEEARARIAAAQKKRWAAARKATA